METTRWRISKWDPRGCPEKGFREESDLLILPQGPDACALVWMSGEDEPQLCWIDRLPLVPSEVPVTVYFGTTPIPCIVSVIRQGKGLLCILDPQSSRGNDGSAGTVAAEGNGPFPFG